MSFAKRVFFVAGVYGVVVLSPFYLLEKKISEDDPPPITRLGFYYGLVGVALAFQVVFLICPTEFKHVRLSRGRKPPE